MSNGSSDVFLQVMDSSGNFQFGSSWGGSGIDIGYGVATDSSNNIYVCGSYQNQVDFDPSSGVDVHNAIGSDDVFTSKFD